MRRRKAESEYHTGRLNISCSPAKKDAIAADATERGQSISQYLLDLYDKSKQAGTSEYIARMGLDLVGMKKQLTAIETALRRSIRRSGGGVDPAMRADLDRLAILEGNIDVTLRETISAMKLLKENEGKLD